MLITDVLIVIYILDLAVQPTKTIKEDPVICKAILALRSQGYSAKDSKSLIKKSYNKHISLEELIKKAFLNDKQLKTRKV